jgi:hypothetical protein
MIPTLNHPRLLSRATSYPTLMNEAKLARRPEKTRGQPKFVPENATLDGKLYRVV